MRSTLVRAGLAVCVVSLAACGGSQPPATPTTTTTAAKAATPTTAAPGAAEEDEYELDDRRIGDGTPGPVTRRLQDLFFAIVRGREDRYRSWLAYV